MKISYRTHPILEKLKEGKLGKFKALDVDNEMFYLNTDFFRFHFDANVLNFKSNIFKISDTFYNATQKAKDKLFELAQDILENNLADLCFSGTFILYDSVIFIDFSALKQYDGLKCVYYRFTKDGIPLEMYVQNKTDTDFSAWCSFALIERNNLRPKEVEHFIMFGMYQILAIYMFKSYAEVETKLLPANKKVKDINCKYVNDTSTDITILDSTWFTNLVKSDAFKVRGHFRLQPKKKDGEWTKELIWINEFQKKGYNRKAKIIMAGNSQGVVAAN